MSNADINLTLVDVVFNFDSIVFFYLLDSIFDLDFFLCHAL